MANTTNFGWETPDDTDLVKDGAAAMRTLGNSIDASFVDLKGGTTGQILSKNSNTDLDYVWINNDQGDITAVTAGTGISGGGTSGAVTITNSMATEITASGDIIVGTGSGTFDNLPIGTTGQVLTADTTVSPYKVKWASAAPSFYGAKVYNSTNLTIANNTLTAITCNSEVYDVGGYHSTTTNTERFTIPSGKDGYYQVAAEVTWSNNATGRRTFRIQKNTGDALYSANTNSNFDACGNHISVNFYLVAGDYVTLYAFQNSGGDLQCYTTNSDQLFSYEITYLGA